MGRRYNQTVVERVKLSSTWKQDDWWVWLWNVMCYFQLFKLIVGYMYCDKSKKRRDTWILCNATGSPQRITISPLRWIVELEFKCCFYRKLLNSLKIWQVVLAIFIYMYECFQFNAWPSINTDCLMIDDCQLKFLLVDSLYAEGTLIACQIHCMLISNVKTCWSFWLCNGKCRFLASQKPSHVSYLSRVPNF